jgi:hypothetical protein
MTDFYRRRALRIQWTANSNRRSPLLNLTPERIRSIPGHGPPPVSDLWKFSSFGHVLADLPKNRRPAAGEA